MKKALWGLSVLIFLVVLAPFFLLAMVGVLLSWSMPQLLFWWVPVSLTGAVALALWYYDSYHRTQNEPFEDPYWP